MSQNKSTKLEGKLDNENITKKMLLIKFKNLTLNVIKKHLILGALHFKF